MIWFVLAGLVLFSTSGYLFARGRAAAAARKAGRRPHSLASQHGAYVAIWSAVPALVLLFALLLFGGRLETALLESRLPESVRSLPAMQQDLFVRDAQSVARGLQRSEARYDDERSAALESLAADSNRLNQLISWGGTALAGVLALMGAAFAFLRIGPDFRARNKVEGWISVLLACCSIVAVATTVGIVMSLLWESSRFFAEVSPIDFLTGTQWSPQIAMRADQAGQSGAFGAVPLFVGTFLIMLIAMVVAGPVGLFSAIFLAEYASPPVRAVVKPLLEILAGVPTVVYGFFAALTVGPSFRWAFNALGEKLIGGPLDSLGHYLMTVQNQMALVAGVVMGIMLIPFVSSLADDVINAVPQSLRDGSYAMGATKSETISRVVLPAALPGVAGAFLLAVSRAIGETMIVTMAAGLQAKMTMNPLESVTTVTVQIVTLLTGDQEFDSAKTLAAFGLGLTLFVVTLILNVIALRIVQAYREQYD